MIGRIKDWWRTRQVIKIGTAEVERFNGELGECRKIIISAADEAVSQLKDELSGLKSDPDFGLDLCRDAWRSWHDDGEDAVELYREAVHKRLSPFMDFARVMDIEAQMEASINQAVDECKAYYLLSGADAYAEFANSEGLIPDEE